MIYLDTHVVVWLYANLSEKFRSEIRTLINHQTLRISPIVRLELRYLQETGRIQTAADTILTDLEHRIGLSICLKPFNLVISQAQSIPWTRDVFDRIIVAQAAIDQNLLITKDQKILENYPLARW